MVIVIATVSAAISLLGLVISIASLLLGVYLRTVSDISLIRRETRNLENSLEVDIANLNSVLAQSNEPAFCDGIKDINSSLVDMRPDVRALVSLVEELAMEAGKLRYLLSLPFTGFGKIHRLDSTKAKIENLKGKLDSFRAIYIMLAERANAVVARYETR
ncbi:hypothetical protein ACS8E6_03585 [Salinicola halophyticus]|uniref:hypothetical protein n=1 Tax=Salinicola halophyticus TaxID=1808881 RepID=UPI003F489B7D